MNPALVFLGQAMAFTVAALLLVAIHDGLEEYADDLRKWWDE